MKCFAVLENLIQRTSFPPNRFLLILSCTGARNLATPMGDDGDVSTIAVARAEADAQEGPLDVVQNAPAKRTVCITDNKSLAGNE